MNAGELLLQGRIDSLMSQRRRMVSTLRIHYQSGAWAASSPKAQLRSRIAFRSINAQLRRAEREMITYRESRETR